MKTTQQLRQKKTLQLAVIYALISGIWIFFSDTILGLLFSDSIEKLEEYSIIKGMFFVVTTSCLFYFFCRKWQRYLKSVEDTLEYHEREVVTGKAVQSSIFEVANEALFIVDKETLRILEVNESACVMYGYSKKDFLDTLSVLDLSNQQEASITAINKETIRVEYGLHKKSNGQIFPVDITLTYFTLDNRRIFAASVRDMSMHYELVKSLKASEQKFIDAQLMGNVGNWTWDIRSGTVHWSPGLYKISGITPSELPTTREDFFELIHPEDRELVSEKLDSLYKNKQPVYWESRIIVHEGQIRFVTNQCLIKVDKSGEPIELVGTIADITERKMAEIEIVKLNQRLEQRVAERTQELVEMNRDKDEILSIAAHDLRNPLGGILLQSALVKMFYEKGQAEQARARIDDIEKSVQRMNDIITNLLNSHSLEMGQYAISLEEFDSADIVKLVVDTFEAQANRKDISIDTQFSTPSSMYADSSAFREVMENLLSNAIKYSPQHKHIYVRVETTAEHKVRVEVRDEGPGISTEDQKNLFKKFTRLTAKPTAGETSSGLGLSIVKKIVEHIHGTIWCESTLGEGAVFIVELPVSAPLKI